MGVSGCGKSTIGEALVASIENAVYLEGDDFHPDENIARMRQGKALQDQDRWPWFDAIIAEANRQIALGKRVLIGCSALKKSYREYLSTKLSLAPELIYLQGDFEMIYQRVNKRSDHFMPSDLLESQFQALEEPDSDLETCLKISIEESVEEIVNRAMRWLNFT